MVHAKLGFATILGAATMMPANIHLLQGCPRSGYPSAQQSPARSAGIFASSLYSNRCKSELGKLKIEKAPHRIKEFVALKPKAYSYTTTESDQVYHNTLKGVPKHIRDSLNLEAYKECLYSNTRISKDIFNLRFYNSDMSLTKNSKIIPSPFGTRDIILMD